MQATAHIDNAVASSSAKRELCAWQEQTKNKYFYEHMIIKHDTTQKTHILKLKGRKSNLIQS